MLRSIPRVSIAMPVRNGERFIRQAIDSLLAQTFSDFELIICDNASKDATEAICREYMLADSRVRYHRNRRNLGPAGNHNMGVALARGAYFRWHAHDDMCEPDHLRRCVTALDADPTAVLAYPGVTIVDEVGTAIESYDFKTETDNPSACKRFASLVLVNHRQHRACEIFGLMRLDALRQTPLQGAFARGDSVLLTQLAIRGRFIDIPDRLFLSRSHGEQSMQTLPSNVKSGRSRLSRWLGTGPLPPPEWWDASVRGKPVFPEWNLFKEYWRTVDAAPLTIPDRIRCYAIVLMWLARNPHKLIRDVAFAAETVTTGAK